MVVDPAALEFGYGLAPFWFMRHRSITRLHAEKSRRLPSRRDCHLPRAPSALASLTILFTFQRLVKVTAELGSTAARSPTCREAGNDQSRLRAIWVRLAAALVQELI